MEMTEQTPNTMPRTVRRDRRRCSHILFMPRQTVRIRRATEKSPTWAKFGFALLVSVIAGHFTVVQPNASTRALGEFFGMGYNNESLALRVQFVEKIENLGAGFRIQITGRFIGENDEGIVR